MQSALRRTVEGWMGDLLYQKLGDEPSTELAWNLLRDLIGQQLFGTEFIPVPFIESATYYNQLFVFIKKQSVLSSLGLRPPTYKVIGNMDYLVNRDVSTWSPQFDFSPWDVADSRSAYREYRLRITSNQVGIEKSIDLKVIEPHARSAQPPIPGTLEIHRNLLQDLERVKTLYVITDVVLASYLKITVKIGNRQMVFLHDRDIPIAFKYRKYKLHQSGSFLSELNTNLKIFKNEAIWLRPCPQPIPNMPLWDHLRRRYDNGLRRKMRHNLTIPTPTEVPDRGGRRANRPEGGIIRLERAMLNGPVVRAREVIHMEEDNERRQQANVRRHQSLHRRVPLRENIRRMQTVSMEALQGSE